MSIPIAFVSRYDETQEKEWLDALQTAMPQEVIISIRAMDEAARAATEVAIVANPDPKDVALLTNLKWLHSVWAGVERLVAELGERAVPIVRLIDPEMSRTMAESVLAWSYYLQRDMPLYAHQQRQKIWQPLPYNPPANMTIGLVGLGVLGQAAAQRLLEAGFKVAGWSRSVKQLANIETFTGDDGLDMMLSKSDIVILLLPLTRQTYGLMDEARFAVMKKGACLINFARGAIIKTQALLDALEQGLVAHAVLDVFINEPISDDCPYWHHPKVTVLPHISGPTPLASSASIVAHNIAEWRRSGHIPQAIDFMRGY